MKHEEKRAPTIEIIPAVLPKSFGDLKTQLERLRGVTRHVQVDIVDGHFAKGKTWPYKDGDMFATIVDQEHGLPLWEELDFEFDLMVVNPLEVASQYMKAGASRVIIHAASPGAVEAAQQLSDFNEDSGSFTVHVGIALSCLESPELLEPYEEQFDFVQVMGIEHIGKQGEPLSPKALYLLERLRHRYPTLPLQIDGGVRVENARQLVAAGATRLVSGSAILGAEDAHAAFAALYNEVNGVAQK